MPPWRHENERSGDVPEHGPEREAGIRMDQPFRPLGVITGATSGIGAAFAEALAEEGYDLLLTGRRETLLAERSRSLEQRFGIRVEALRVELDRPQEVRRLAERLRSLEVDLLVNNAGFGVRCDFLRTPPRTWEALMDLQVRCPLELTQAVLPGMVARGRGGVVNVASEASFLPVPRNGVYAGVKAFLLRWTESLALELEGSGVTVQALCPGLTRTDFHGRLGEEGARLSRSRWIRWLTPEMVVRASLGDLKRGRAVCVPGWGSRARIALLSLLPRSLRLALLGRFFRSASGKR